MKSALQIAFGIVLGFGVITLGSWAVSAMLIHQGSEAISQTLERSQQEATQARQIAERRRQQAELEQQAMQRARLASQREQAAARRAAELAKARAWSSYYQHPEECETPRSETHHIECINRRIRARRQFEIEYSGKPHVIEAGR